MTTFTRTVLFTDVDGRARFKEEDIALDQGSEKTRLSALLPTKGLQLRQSPVGFQSEFHVSSHAQWVFILQGQMEIGLQDGSSKVFGPGEHFFSADLLPKGAVFDPKVHGHCSRQVGEEALVTVFVKV
jgi:oxalate decarboxylase/phosphoglucose isomerase-like protein (cupin superfamily)